MRSPSGSWRQLRSWMGVGAAFAALACWEGKEIAPLPVPSFGEVVPRVSLADAGEEGIGTFAPDSSPVGSSAGSPTVNVWSAAVMGGSTRIEVTSNAPFDRVVIDGGTQLKGYWDVVLPAATTSASLVLTVAPTVIITPIPTRVAVGMSGGPLSQFAPAPIEVLSVGTGEVQMSVSWDAQTDVDLHVFDPSGEEVYFGNLQSASGGRLDLDSNAACNIDGKRNENITWPFGSAPRGEYRVVVHLWSACALPRTRYVVTVRRQGMAPQVFTGEFNATTPTTAEIGRFTY